MKVDFLPRPRVPGGPISGYANVFRAISSGERDIGILLRLLDERLLMLESRPLITIDNIHDLDFRVDAEAVVLLKALYVQIRVYIDSIAGVIRYFYNRSNLPMTFNGLLKKVGTPAIPSDLSEVLSFCSQWFQPFKKTRDDFVHYYEDFLLLVYGKEDEKVIHHASFSKRDGIKAFDYGSIRDNVGELLKNIQILVDSLLDNLDKRFCEWYGFVQSQASRTQTGIEGGYFLYWAHKYGGYTHRELHVQEAQPRALTGEMS
jgi:hypothetical protein